MLKLAILLTATVDVGGVAHTEISDPSVRLAEYRDAMRCWMDAELVSHIIFCENSGYDLSALRTDIERCGKNKSIEILQFDGQNFDRMLGKGFGELSTLSFVSQHSDNFTSFDLLLKVNGRYFIQNIDAIVRALQALDNSTIIGDFRMNLSWMDSRVFAFRPAFLTDYLMPFQSIVNDSAGVYFEHVLARAVHQAMADGKHWQMLPACPVLKGKSGSTGGAYSVYGPRRVAKALYLWTLRKLLQR